MTRGPGRARDGSASPGTAHTCEITCEELGADAAPGFRRESAFLLLHGNDIESTRPARGTRVDDTCRRRDHVGWLHAIRAERHQNDDQDQVVSRDPCRRAVVNRARIADLYRQIADAFDELAASSNGKRRRRRRPSITKTRPPGESDERARDEARRILRERGFVGGSSDD